MHLSYLPFILDVEDTFNVSDDFNVCRKKTANGCIGDLRFPEA